MDYGESFWGFIVAIFVSLAVEPQVPDKAPAKNGSSFNQLLGIKGASQETVSRQMLAHYISFSTFSLCSEFSFFR